MKYDAEQISKRVEKKRRIFWQKTAFILSVMFILLVLSILNFSDYLTVLAAMIEFPMMLLLTAVIKKSDAKTLLGKEIRGINRKEYEYAIQSDNRVKAFSKGVVPHTFANIKAHALRLNGTVYLELENGDIKSVTGLYKSHMDIYEEGDTLVKYAGTRFPIVLDREVKKQPCPICGEINDESLNECKACGLMIVKNKNYVG